MYKKFKLTTLAGAIALAMGSTAAYAAAPAATQLPGQGEIASGTVTAVSTPTAGGAQTITLGSNVVIDWGKGTDINKTGVAGFNIGSDASLTFDGTGAVLNVDVSGNASQIFGTLQSTAGNLYVANTNGIIVGAGAKITASGAEVGLIGNALGPTSGFAGNITSVGYNGTGGDVTVAAGAHLNGGTVLISGGNMVNVDLGSLESGNVALNAGMPVNGGAFADKNPDAMLTVSGDLAGATLTSVFSAGDATNNGKVDTSTLVDGDVAGVLTNNGTLDAAAGFVISGSLVNEKTLNAVDLTLGGDLTNDGEATITGPVAVDGGITNNGKFVATGQTISAGSLDNVGTFTSGAITTAGDFNNSGEIKASGDLNINGGDFTNSGSLETSGAVHALNGSISNSGQLSVGGGGFAVMTTGSDETAAGFTPGADYSITNTGTVTSPGILFLSANGDAIVGQRGGTAANDSTGSVTNAGVLQVGAGGWLALAAYNDVTLGGSVQALHGTKYAALSAANPLGLFDILAGNYDGTVLSTDGVATLATDITTSGGGYVVGNQVRLMANLSSVNGTGTPTGTVQIVAGAASDEGYAVRVASGKTITADTINVDGDTAGDVPNVILQGTLAASQISFGAINAVGDIFSGPNGGLEMWGSPSLIVNSTGRVKTAPYLNDANNFRYNYLPVTVDDGSTLDLAIDPSIMQGTPTSGVNLLVNGDVHLSSGMAATVHAGDSAVTGVNPVPNSHMVLQSTGNITTGAAGGANGTFYWPGYIYLGNIAADADGNALPGTLGLGTITTTGEFNNVLPGDIAGASGIHFITQFPMTIVGDVVTNANAWVNFGTALLTEAYSTGTLPGNFYGGTKGSGTVVNYGPLDPSNFVTQPPVSEK
jgi:filamentous hemagglutinin family protein